MCKWCSQNVHILDSVCTLFCPSPRSPLKHVTRLGHTRYWISATGLMVVQGRMREIWCPLAPESVTGRLTFRIFRTFLDKIGSKIDCQVCRFSELTKLTISHWLEVSPLQQCTYTLTCYIVIPHSANVILFRNSRNCPTLDSAVCNSLPNNVTSLWQQ